MTILTGIVCAIIAGLMPLASIAELANAGTLAAFIATALALLILRRREPDLHRPFRAPLAYVIAPAAILGCAYLFYSLPFGTQRNFFIWMGIGVVVYFLYSRKASNMTKAV